MRSEKTSGINIAKNRIMCRINIIPSKSACAKSVDWEIKNRTFLTEQGQTQPLRRQVKGRRPRGASQKNSRLLTRGDCRSGKSTILAGGQCHSQSWWIAGRWPSQYFWWQQLPPLYWIIFSNTAPKLCDYKPIGTAKASRIVVKSKIEWSCIVDVKWNRYGDLKIFSSTDMCCLISAWEIEVFMFLGL